MNNKLFWIFGLLFLSNTYRESGFERKIYVNVEGDAIWAVVWNCTSDSLKYFYDTLTVDSNFQIFYQRRVKPNLDCMIITDSVFRKTSNNYEHLKYYSFDSSNYYVKTSSTYSTGWKNRGDQNKNFIYNKINIEIYYVGKKNSKHMVKCDKFAKQIIKKLQQ